MPNTRGAVPGILAGLRSIAGVTCAEPSGAFYAFPDISARLDAGTPDDTALAKQLLERQSVAVVPGGAFGAPGFLRFSYATSIERIDEGMRRLAAFFSVVASAK